jgi:hypothetical protein
MIDHEQLAQEAQLFSWIDSDCMSDGFIEEDFFDEANLFDEMDEE